ESSPADFVLLDAGKGSGEKFDWSLIKGIKRPFFLAGGLDPRNAAAAVRETRPYAVDVSSGIEINGVKDKHQMARFITAVREEEKL
ncbi:MAG: phosphoribosylanthranilate isomerase, partial [Ruminococcus sp.]|nr:phosphoribosylanthranilate isomerase [Ruminococcus sp.]